MSVKKLKTGEGLWEVRKDILGWMMANGKDFRDLPFSGAQLAEMVGLIEDGTISGKIGKEILPELLVEGGSARAVVEAKGLSQVSDPAEIAAIIDEVMAANPQQLEQFRAGKTKLQGFFTGQVMKNLHVVFTMNPSADGLKDRAATSPALFNR